VGPGEPAATLSASDRPAAWLRPEALVLAAGADVLHDALRGAGYGRRPGERRFVVYSRGQGWLTTSWIVLAPLWSGATTVPTDSVREAVDGVLAALGPDETIGSLQLWSHGNPGWVLVGKEHLVTRDFEASSPASGGTAGQRELARLRPRISPTSFVYFRTCLTFRGLAGRGFARAAARFLGCRVAGHTEVIGPRQPGYLEFDPPD
jgi:hypothetical protein